MAVLLGGKVTLNNLVLAKVEVLIPSGRIPAPSRSAGHCMNSPALRK